MKPKYPPTAVTDEQLIMHIREGNHEAFSELYKRYFKKVYYRCFTFTREHDEAFDHAQESLLKAFMNLNTFKGKAQFSTWLFAIASNHCLATVRKRTRLNRQKYSDAISYKQHEYILAEDQWMEPDVYQTMETLVNNLPANERELLEMKYRDNTSIEALAAKFGLHESAVKMRLKRTRDKLNSMYAGSYHQR